MTEQPNYPIGHDVISKYEKELLNSLPQLYPDEGDRGIVETILIPQFRLKLQEVFDNFLEQRKNPLTNSIVPNEIPKLCKAIDEMIQENRELLAIDKLLKPALQKIRESRQQSRDELTEQFQNDIRSDLESYAKLLGPDKTPLDLNTKNESNEITCFNSRTVKWGTYLRTSGVALGLAKDTTEASKKQKVILKELLKIAEYETEEEYFTNPKNVKTDLQSYAGLLGQDKTPLDLTTKNTSNEITCSNGRNVKWNTYLITAGKALGLAKDNKEAGTKKKAILKELLRIAGYETKEYATMDTEYFTNPKNVKTNLESYAKLLGSDKTSLDLATTNKSNEITCSNGRNVKWSTYLRTAGIALGLAQNNKEADNKKQAILKELLKIAGYEIKEYAPMDAEYFTNPKTVKTDLQSYAGLLGQDKTPLDLATKNTSNEITCSNRRTVKWQTYLNTAGKALGLAKNNKEASTKKKAILKELLRIAGYRKY